MTLGEHFGRALAAARAGAEWGLTELYRDLHAPLLRYLRAQEPADAEDLASEVWIDVASGLGRFEGDERGFRRWLFTIAHRRLLDIRRSRSRRRTDPMPVERFEDLSVGGRVEDEALTTITAQEAIAKIVEVLSPDQAEVMLLRTIAELSAEETASVMGKRAGTVRVLQHRALERLAREFQQATVTGLSPGAM